MVCLKTDTNCFEVEMNNTDRKRKCDSTIGVRFPVDVREAIERAAARELCSSSSIVRRLTVEGLRAAGLLLDEAGP